jgi:hypothetical protein
MSICDKRETEGSHKDVHVNHGNLFLQREEWLRERTECQSLSRSAKIGALRWDAEGAREERGTARSEALGPSPSSCLLIIIISRKQNISLQTGFGSGNDLC